MSDQPSAPFTPDESDRLISKCFWITTIGVIAFAISVYLLVL